MIPAVLPHARKAIDVAIEASTAAPTSASRHWDANKGLSAEQIAEAKAEARAARPAPCVTHVEADT